MFEEFGFEELTPVTASVLLGLVLGLAYGALAQRSAFCLAAWWARGATACRRSAPGSWRWRRRSPAPGSRSRST